MTLERPSRPSLFVLALFILVPAFPSGILLGQAPPALRLADSLLALDRAWGSPTCAGIPRFFWKWWHQIGSAGSRTNRRPETRSWQTCGPVATGCSKTS